MRAGRGGALESLLAQTGMEIRLTLRGGEGVLITIVVPIVLLVFFAAIGIKPSGYSRSIDFLLPGMLALAVMSVGLVSLSIRTAYERSYGVLKRLGATPLPRASLLGAKVISVVLIELIEIVLLVLISALAYDWRPTGAFGLAVVALVLGTIVFSAFGLLMAGALRAETTLAAANGLYLLFLLVGGIVYPVDKLGPVSDVARLLPSSAFADALRSTLSPPLRNGSFPTWLNLVILAVWCVAALVLASRTFEWE